MAVLGHATSWFGADSPARSSASSTVASNAVAELGGLLSGASSVVGQVFAWLFVLLAFELVCCAFGFVVGEIKLRRLYDRPSWRGRWVRPSRPMVDPRPAGGSRHPL